MSQDESRDSSLDARLEALPREIAPARDLWPEVRSRLEAVPAAVPAARPQPRRWLPLALAAGIAIAVTAGFLGAQFGREQPGAGHWPLAFQARAERDFAAPESANYLRTRATLERTYRERLQLLAPETRRRIEQDVATIRAANEDIRRSLAADPESAVLNRLLESTWQQEFDLYSTVVRNTEPATDTERNRT
jgi:hypothetical protein